MRFIRLVFWLFGIIMGFAKITIAQTTGCTDFRAINFNQNAKFNDGSCTYNSTTGVWSKLVDKLSDTINETSGIINIGGELWTMGDSGNPNAIYRFDKSTGTILQTIIIGNAVNIDWEDMTADANNIYVGDFGNNNGNRTNLCVYKFSRSLITTKKIDTVIAEKIAFNYTDQTNFQSRSNANRYDAEAMFVWDDTLHLFSKDWIDGHTKHYLLPATTGNHSISPIDSFDAGCLITGACIDTSSKRIVLIGYTKTGFCNLWLLWDFHDKMVFSGNKRKIDLGFFTTTGQTEAVCFRDSSTIYFTNEIVSNFVNNRLYSLEVGQWMNPKTNGNAVLQNMDETLLVFVTPNPASSEITINFKLKKSALIQYDVYNCIGRVVYHNEHKYNSGKVSQKLDISEWKPGIYEIVIQGIDGSMQILKFLKA